MKRFLLGALGLLALGTAALAQVNTVPQTGVITGYVPKQTYSAVAIGLVAPASPTDIFCIAGSASKTIRVHGIRMSGTATSAQVTAQVVVLRRATADTGGTPAGTTANPANTVSKMDSTFGAHTATLVSYTANPTINDTSPTYIRAQTLTLPLATAGIATPLLFDFSAYARVQGQIPTLRGAAQQLCINLNAATIANNVLQIDIQWSEE